MASVVVIEMVVWGILNSKQYNFTIIHMDCVIYPNTFVYISVNSGEQTVIITVLKNVCQTVIRNSFWMFS